MTTIYNKIQITKFKGYILKNPPEVLEEGKWMKVITSWEIHNPIFERNEHKKGSNFFTPKHSDESETKQSIRTKSSNQIKLHVEEINKRGSQKWIGLLVFKKTEFENHAMGNEILNFLKNLGYNYFEANVFTMKWF